MLDIDATIERTKRHVEKQILAGESVGLTLAVIADDGDLNVYAGIPEEPDEEGIALARSGCAYIVSGHMVGQTMGEDILPDAKEDEAMVFYAQNQGQAPRVFIERFRRSSLRPRLEWLGPGEVKPEQCKCDWIGLLTEREDAR